MHATVPSTSVNRSSRQPISIEEIKTSMQGVQRWMEQRDYKGHDPYDLLNSPFLAGQWARKLPFTLVIRQMGTRLPGETLRRVLRVPHGTNPKALGLALSAYCDLARCGADVADKARYLRARLRQMRSPAEEFYCWGYDFDSIALRTTTLLAGKPNIIATLFCGNALLDMADVMHDREAEEMGNSVAEFIVNRLNRHVEANGDVCFSYSPSDHTEVYNTSALTAAFLARVGERTGNDQFLALASRAIAYLLRHQRPDGSWFYGARPAQRWIDSFHTGYNLCALQQYRIFTKDDSVDEPIRNGYRFLKSHFFRGDGAVGYYHNQFYPVDVHSCAQAIITLCDLQEYDDDSLRLASRIALWTARHMQSPDGHFAYRQHRSWTNRTPYMRWGQAWMFRALARLHWEVFNVV